MNSVKKIAIFAGAAIAGAAASAASIGNVVVNQMWPWSTKVAIDYELICNPGETWDVSLTVRDEHNNEVTGLSNAIYGDIANVAGGAHRLIWDPGRSLATGSAPVLSYTLSLRAPLGKKYMIVDLTRDGEGKFSVSYLDEEPSGGFNTEEYTTTKMVFRRCPAGSFMMGSPDDEPGHDYYSSSDKLTDSEKQRKVTLTKDFYLSIFELTVCQTHTIWPDYYDYSNVNVTNSYRKKRALMSIYPCHFRNATNTTVSAVDWASSTSVDPTSLIGQFRAGIPGGSPISGYVFDLPTEAQWEYACRAGTTNVWNNDGSWSPADSYGHDGNSTAARELDVKTGENADTVLRFLGKYRYDYNETTGHFEWDQSQSINVGRYQPDAWGFYDMHGNVAEMCADVWVNSGYDGSDLVDPVRGGGTTGWIVSRGGSWANNARECRSASRGRAYPPTKLVSLGARLALVPERPVAQ